MYHHVAITAKEKNKQHNQLHTSQLNYVKVYCSSWIGVNDGVSYSYYSNVQVGHAYNKTKRVE